MISLHPKGDFLMFIIHRTTLKCATMILFIILCVILLSCWLLVSSFICITLNTNHVNFAANPFPKMLKIIKTCCATLLQHTMLHSPNLSGSFAFIRLAG